MSDLTHARQRLADLEREYLAGAVPAEVVEAHRQPGRTLRMNGHASMPLVLSKEQRAIALEVETHLRAWRGHAASLTARPSRS